MYPHRVYGKVAKTSVRRRRLVVLDRSLRMHVGVDLRVGWTDHLPGEITSEDISGDEKRKGYRRTVDALPPRPQSWYDAEMALKQSRPNVTTRPSSEIIPNWPGDTVA